MRESWQKHDDQYEVNNEGCAEITRARQLARYLCKYQWYFPASDQNAHDDDGRGVPPPKLDSGWAHFENVGLPRCHLARDVNGNFHRAEPGESEHQTKLYPVWGTTLIDLGDFGRGVGLYFTSLRELAIITFIAGLINVPAMVYLNSDRYSAEGRTDIALLLRASAACTDTSWEACPTCNANDWDQSTDRFAMGKASDGSELPFVKVNNCEMDNMFWIPVYSSMIFVFLAILLISFRQKKKSVKLDEATQTTTDYSIAITNPPADAKDPDAWKEFFEKNNFIAKVEVVTVAINNEKLIKALIERRRLLLNLENMLPLGTEFDVEDLDGMAKLCGSVSIFGKIFCCAKSPQRIVEDIGKKEDEIFELTKEEFNVSRVFVTFDTEASQRNVLEKLYTAKYKRHTIDSSQRYDGTILKVHEPDEPVSIRWTDLSDTTLHQLGLQIFTTFLSLCIITGAAFLIAYAQSSEAFSAIEVTIIILLMNISIPLIVRLITSYESHYNESSKEASQYYKITAFRWLVTVIIPFVSVPFANILDEDKIIQYVETQLVAEIIQRPVMQIFSIFGLLHRHILGPRAVDQRRMNLLFAGDYYSMGERYTDVTKVLFLTVFYCILYPMGFFFASAIFVMYYWVDKFSILRSWHQGPTIGAQISVLSMFFFKVCALAYAIMAAYMVAQIPYDNACVSEDEELSKYTNFAYMLSHDGGREDRTITTTDKAYKFCHQNLIDSGTFPPLPNLQSQEGRGYWMDRNQETFSKLFGWTAVAVLTIVLFSFVKWCYYISIYPLFFKKYQPHGKDQEQAFKEIREIAAYVPQVSIPGFSFPFLICKDDVLNKDHVGWSIPKEKGYDNQNLVIDVAEILKKRESEQKNDETVTKIFSTVKSFDPHG